MLGGNIGPVEENFDFVVEELHRYGVRRIRRSSIYRSAAVDCVPGTPDFCDQAVVADWGGPVEELFGFCRQLERRCGRPEKHSSRESRTLDCDLIFWGDEEISTPELTVPHPRAKERLFVLEPLSEIAPDWRFPDGTTVQQALDALKK